MDLHGTFSGKMTIGAAMNPGKTNLHHDSVCMVTAPYPLHESGTGVLLEYRGYFCVAAAVHLIPSVASASTALVSFPLPGSQATTRVQLQPQALFEYLRYDGSDDNNRSQMVIAACERPVISPVHIMPARLAPPTYAETLLRFMLLGWTSTPRVSREAAMSAIFATRKRTSHTSSRKRAPSFLQEKRRARAESPSGRRQRRRHCRDIESQAKAYAKARTRRGGIVPGTRAWRRPGDPGPVQPFKIEPEDGSIMLELVAYPNGKAKAASRLAVPGGREERMTTAMEGRTRGEQRRGAAMIAVTTAGKDPPDGVQGAPVFLGGQLLGFAVQERIGADVTYVIPASALGLLPPKQPDDDHPPATTPPERLRSDRTHPKRICQALAPSTESPTPKDIASDSGYLLSQSDDGGHGGGDGCRGSGDNVVMVRRKFGVGNPGNAEVSNTTACIGQASSRTTGCTVVRSSLPEGGGQDDDVNRAGIGVHYEEASYEKMIHLFRHGTPAALELELARVGRGNLRALRTPDGRSLLHLAATSDRLIPLEFVRSHLHVDIKAEKVTETGNTALHLAAYSGCLKSLQYLCAQGGDAFKKNRDGHTPAMLAALTGRMDVSQWLLENTKELAKAPEGGVFHHKNRMGYDILDLVEDLDEAAVYGSPMYRLLDDAFHKRDPETDGSDGTNDEVEVADEDRGQPLECDPASDTGALEECGAAVDFEKMWKLYLGGEIDASKVLEVLVRLHGVGLRAAWPRILAALPTSEPRLLEALEVEMRAVHRANTEANTLAREEARRIRAARQALASPGDMPDVCLRSSAVKYLRDNISAEQLHSSILQTVQGAKADAVVGKMSKSMPEGKARDLMQVHRAHRREERLSKKRSRKSRRAEASIKTRKQGVAPGSGQSGEEDSSSNDDVSSIASVFSIGSSKDSLSTFAGKGPDLGRAVTLYRKGRMTAIDFHALLSRTFGSQMRSIAPEILSSLPSKKRREMAKLWLIDTTSRSPSRGAPALFTPTHAKESGGEELALETTPNQDRVDSSIIFRTDPEAPHARQGGRGRAGRTKEHRPVTKEGWRNGIPDGAGIAVEAAPASVLFEHKSPFTTRVTSWTANEGCDEQLPRACRVRQVTRDITGMSDDGSVPKAPSPALPITKDKRKSMEAEAKRLTSDFAMGKLTAPHFFGAMLEEFGEEKLLAVVPSILEILPKDKATELEAFTIKTQDGAGTTRICTRKDTKRGQGKEKQKLSGQDESRQEDNNFAEGGAARKVESCPREEDPKARTHEEIDVCIRPNMAVDDDIPAKRDITKLPTAAISDTTMKEKGEREERAILTEAEDHSESGEKSLQDQGVFVMSDDESMEYGAAFSRLCPTEGGAIKFKTAAASLAKNGLRRNILRKVWDMADVDRDKQLNRQEWAVAMHLIACATQKKLPLPDELPKCLQELASLPVGQGQQPNPHPQQSQSSPGPTVIQSPEIGGRAPGKKYANKSTKKASDITPKHEAKQQSDKKNARAVVGEVGQVLDKSNSKAARVDLKTATKEFKNGKMEAEAFLPLLEEAFGKEKLQEIWPKLLPTLPGPKAAQLAEVAGVEFNAGRQALKHDLAPVRQVNVKRNTACFKRGEMGASEYYEETLKVAFTDQLPHMLPKLLKALPSERAAALVAVVQADDDDVRRLKEDEPDPWAMTLQDRRVYDNAFAKLDKDRSGFLSSEEAWPPLSKAAGKSFPKTQLDHLWKLADTDQDDRLSREEWAIAYHIVRCVIKRQLTMPPTLPESLEPMTTGGARKLPRL